MSKIELEVNCTTWIDHDGTLCSDIYICNGGAPLHSGYVQFGQALDDMLGGVIVPTKIPTMRKANKKEILKTLKTMRKAIDRRIKIVSELEVWEK